LRPSASAPSATFVSALLVLAALLLLAPSHARAQGSADAADLVYEAADALDQARAELEAGRQSSAEKWISQAERQLERARELDPDLPRLGFETARLHRLDGTPDIAEEVLVASMLSELPFGEHVRSVELLNAIRVDLGKPSVGEEWRQTQLLRDVGIGTVAGGLVASVIGFAIAFGTFAQEAYTGVTDKGIGGNRFGWGLSIAGGGVAIGGGVLTLAGQTRLVRLRRILPGPWRLSGAPGLERGPAIIAGPAAGAALQVRFGGPKTRAR
jgi:hypothetical protein